jgi:hypothetical protein
MMHRAVKLAAIDQTRGDIEVSLLKAQQRIDNSTQSLPNVDFSQDEPT